jgi:hypothetical protein
LGLGGPCGRLVALPVRLIPGPDAVVDWAHSVLANSDRAIRLTQVGEPGTVLGWPSGKSVPARIEGETVSSRGTVQNDPAAWVSMEEEGGDPPCLVEEQPPAPGSGPPVITNAPASPVADFPMRQERGHVSIRQDDGLPVHSAPFSGIRDRR